MTRSRVLYLIACGAGPAREIHRFVELAQGAGWTVCVGATPQGRQFIESQRLEHMTGHPVRSDYDPTGSNPWPRADAVALAPATLNTVNKLSAGIADCFVMSLLCECLGLDVPIVVAPNVNPALARHPRFRSSIESLREWGVTVLFEPSAPPPIWMAPWETVLHAVDRLVPPPTG
ncbi:MAG: flavoprotein [Actinomycetota bacterium]